MTPVITALPGPLTPYQQMKEELENERGYSEALCTTLERVVADRLALRRHVVALQEQLRLSDELAESVRVEMEALRDFCQQHGLNPEQMLED